MPASESAAICPAWYLPDLPIVDAATFIALARRHLDNDSLTARLARFTAGGYPQGWDSWQRSDWPAVVAATLALPGSEALDAVLHQLPEDAGVSVSIFSHPLIGGRQAVTRAQAVRWAAPPEQRGPHLEAIAAAGPLGALAAALVGGEFHSPGREQIADRLWQAGPAACQVAAGLLATWAGTDDQLVEAATALASR